MLEDKSTIAVSHPLLLLATLEYRSIKLSTFQSDFLNHYILDPVDSSVLYPNPIPSLPENS